MTDSEIIQWLKSMERNCRDDSHGNGYDDPNRKEKADALHFAVYLIKNGGLYNNGQKNRKRGHWVLGADGNYRCSECGCIAYTNSLHHYSPCTDDCQNCGAVM